MMDFQGPILTLNPFMPILPQGKALLAGLGQESTKILSISRFCETFRERNSSSSSRKDIQERNMTGVYNDIVYYSQTTSKKIAVESIISIAKTINLKKFSIQNIHDRSV